MRQRGALVVIGEVAIGKRQRGFHQGAIGGHQQRPIVRLRRDALPGRQLVPHHFLASLRDRERHPATTGLIDCIAIV
ncbi:hypothetical protein D3C78_1896420 [compost metagenome]